MRRVVARFAGPIALVAWWAFIAVRMIVDARHDVGPTGLPYDLPNWHNLPGDLRFYLALSVAESLTVLSILRPLSYSYSWRRALGAFVLMTPWTLFWGLFMIHSGGIMVLHFFWLVGVWIGLALLTGVSWIAGLVVRRSDHAVRAI